MKMFSIFDVKADVYQQLFVMHTRAQAIRAFSDLANDKFTDVGKHPEDFKLVCVGTFDVSTGEVVPEPQENLGFASE